MPDRWLDITHWNLAEVLLISADYENMEILEILSGGLVSHVRGLV